MATVVGITGSRHAVPTAAEIDRFEKLWTQLDGWLLVHGDCPGPGGSNHSVDRYVARQCSIRGRAVAAVPAAWNFYERAAGPVRNGWLVRLLTATSGVLIAFPGGKGTANCIKQAERAKVPVYFTSDWRPPVAPADVAASVEGE